MTPCKFFKHGACRYGDNCRFSHVVPPPDYTRLVDDMLSSQEWNYTAKRTVSSFSDANFLNYAIDYFTRHYHFFEFNFEYVIEYRAHYKSAGCCGRDSIETPNGTRRDSSSESFMTTSEEYKDTPMIVMFRSNEPDSADENKVMEYMIMLLTIVRGMWTWDGVSVGGDIYLQSYERILSRTIDSCTINRMSDKYIEIKTLRSQGVRDQEIWERITRK